MTDFEKINSILNKAQNYIIDGRLKDSISLLKDAALINHNNYLIDKIKLEEESYNYLIYYFIQQTPDPNRKNILNEIKRNLLEISDQIRRYAALRIPPLNHYIEFLNNLQLNLEIQTLDEDNLEWFFAQILILPKISQEDYQKFKDFFTSDTHWVAKAMAVSALFLNLLISFDQKKIELLIDVILHKQEQIWERAFISLLFILYYYDQRLKLYPEILEKLPNIKELPAFEEILKFSIIQILRSAKETELIQQKLEKEIIPEIESLSPKLHEKFMEFEELEDFDEENPEWQKRFIEELEQESQDLVEKLSELSQLYMEGADVMHSAFAKLKDFPFFFRLSNWFLPFFPDNQQIIGFIEQLGVETSKAEKFVKYLSDNPYMCNSDKYSFCFQLPLSPLPINSVIDLMQLESSTIKEIDDVESLSDPLGKSRNILLQYIRDLYRFFKVYKFLEPFPKLFDLKLDFFNKEFFKLLANNEIILNIGDFLLDKKIYTLAVEVFHYLEHLNTQEIYEKLGFVYQKLKNYQKALEYYKKAELFDSKNTWLIKKLAFTNMKLKNFEQALYYYKQLLEIKPDDRKTILNIVTCYINLNKFDQALSQLHQIEYYDPNNPKILRSLGWIYLNTNQLEKALKYFEKLTQHSDKPYDLILFGHTLLANKQISNAVDLYKKALKKINDFDKFELYFWEDAKILNNYNVENYELQLIIDYLK